MKFKLADLITFLIVAVLLNITESRANDWKLISDVDGQRTKLKVGDKSRSYWMLPKQDTLSVTIIGPAQLKAYCRSAIPSKRREVLFGLISVMDGSSREIVGDGATHDKAVRNTRLSKQRISESRSFIYDIPSGEHEIKFLSPPEVKKTMYLRFLISTTTDEEKSWIAYLPRRFQDEVRIVVKEREYIYYRSDSDNPIELEVIGPTRIRGVARLEFDHTIRGEKTFRIQVKEREKILSTQPISAKVSATAKYAGSSENIPARGENFYFDVPAGKHLLEIHTPDIGISVLLRFYIPQKDLSNEVSRSSNNRAGVSKYWQINKNG